MTNESIPRNLLKHSNSINFDIDHIVHGFDRPPQIPPRAKRPIEEHEQYFAIAIDPETGKILKRTSTSLRHAKRKLYETIVPVFQSILDDLPAHYFDLEHSVIAKRTHRLDHNKLMPSMTNKNQDASLPSPRPNKKVRRETPKALNEEEETWARPSLTNQLATFEGPERKPRLAIRLDAVEEWENWFADAFRAVQQLSCRIIAKEWIKTIQPKKQSTHPYNGKVLTSSDPADPDATKPPYWPKDVIHKEPDHINKEQRTKLLVHLLMGTPQKEIHTNSDPPRVERFINAQALKDSLDKRSDELKGKWSIIEQIINARTEIERVNDGGRDGWDVMDVPDFREANRVNNLKSNDSLDETQDEVEGCRSIDDNTADTMGVEGFNLKEEGSSTPISSLGHASAPQTVIGLHGLSSAIMPRDSSVYQPDNDLHFMDSKLSTQSFQSTPQMMQRDHRESQVVQQAMELDDVSYSRDLASQQNRLAAVTLPDDFDHQDLLAGQFHSHQTSSWPERRFAFPGSYRYDPSSTSTELLRQQDNTRRIHPSQLPTSFFFDTTQCENCEQGNSAQRPSPQNFLTDQFGNYLIHPDYGQPVFYPSLATNSSHPGEYHHLQAMTPVPIPPNRRPGTFHGERATGM